LGDWTGLPSVPAVLLQNSLGSRSSSHQEWRSLGTAAFSHRKRAVRIPLMNPFREGEKGSYFHGECVNACSGGGGFLKLPMSVPVSRTNDLTYES